MKKRNLGFREIRNRSFDLLNIQFLKVFFPYMEVWILGYVIGHFLEVKPIYRAVSGTTPMTLAGVYTLKLNNEFKIKAFTSMYA